MFKSGKFVAGLGIGLVCLLLVAATFAFTLPTAQPPAQAAAAAQATPVPGPTSTPVKSEADATKGADKSGKPVGNDNPQYQAAFNKAFAAKLGVSEAALNSAFAGALTETTAQMVKDGILDSNGAAKLQAVGAEGPGSFLPLIGQANAGKDSVPNKSAPLADPKSLFLGAFPDIAPLFKLSVDELRTRFQNGQSLQELAAASNVDQQTLKDAILASIRNQLAAIVKAGKIDQAASDDALKIATSFLDNFLQGAPDGIDMSFKLLFNSDTTWQVVAQLVNLPVNTLRERVDQGQAVLEIAQAQKVDETKLRDTLQTSMQAQLDDLVKNGKLTADQAAKVSPALPKVVEEFINGKDVKSK